MDLSGAECRALRIGKVPSPKQLRAFYNAIAKEPGYQEAMCREPHQKARLARIKELLTVILPFAPRVLEWGCADGLLTRWLAERADWVVAIDWARPCIERCRKLGLRNVGWFCGSLEAYERKALAEEYDGFDLAVASQVLEHCLDPVAEVRRLARLAGGILASVPIAEEPNPDAFSLEARRNPKKPGDGSGHIWCFRPDTFRALFREVWWYEDNGIDAIILGR